MPDSDRTVHPYPTFTPTPGDSTTGTTGTTGTARPRPVPYEEVVHPAHYQVPNGGEILDVIEHLSFNLGSAIKYLYRAGKKPGVSALTDLDKAMFSIQREQERLGLSIKSPPRTPSSASRIDIRGFGPLPPIQTKNTPHTIDTGGSS